MAIYYQVNGLKEKFTPPRPGTWQPNTQARSYYGTQKVVAGTNKGRYSATNIDDVLVERGEE